MAGVEGLSFEYWSPTPFWKANRQYTKEGKDPNREHRLRCLRAKTSPTTPTTTATSTASSTTSPPPIVHDIKTLEDAGLPVLKFGPPERALGRQHQLLLVQVYTVAALRHAPSRSSPRAVREHNPDIHDHRLTPPGARRKYIAPVMKDPRYAELRRSRWSSTHIGDDSNRRAQQRCSAMTRRIIEQELPLFQNEYEYLQGPDVVRPLPQHRPEHHELVPARRLADVVLDPRAQAVPERRGQRLLAGVLEAD